jgi:hypothetical protein
MIRRLHAALVALGTSLGLLNPSIAHAQGKAMDAFPIKEKVRIDGLLREWPALVELSYGPNGGTRAKGLVAYDEQQLYVVMQINDDYLKRTSSYGANEDVARLLIGFPGKSGVKVHKVELFPGDPGKVPGAVRIDGTIVKGAKLVEAPKEGGGYTFEAMFPWSAFSEASTTRVGLTAALQYADYDAQGSKGVISTASGEGSLPPLTLEAEYSLSQSLLRRERLGPAANKEVFGDVAGDAQVERVALFGKYLVIAGWGYRGGKEFYFQDLGVSSSNDVKRLELMDLTNDGKDEIVLQKHVNVGGLERDIFQIWSIDKGKEVPFAALSHEVGVYAEGKRVENRVRIEGAGKDKRIRISQATADEDIDPKVVEMSGGEGLEPTLMPWDSVQSRAYEWNGRSFSKAGEETGKPKVSRQLPTSSSASVAAPVENVPPPPRPPTPDEMMDRVYALYKSEHKVGNAKPRFDFVTDVAADRTAERVLIHGKDLVVFGKAFQDGASYVYLTIGVEEPTDITGATAFDVTGDGKAEIIVYGVLRAKASKNMGGQTINRQVMFIYGARESGVRRIFAAETGRSLGDNVILGRVRFLANGKKGKAIELGPGNAVGWEQNSYPFPQDRFPYGNFEPLLLPWTDMPVRKYSYDGEVFEQQ